MQPNDNGQSQLPNSNPNPPQHREPVQPVQSTTPLNPQTPGAPVQPAPLPVQPVGMGQPPTSTPSSDTNLMPPPKKRKTWLIVSVAILIIVLVAGAIGVFIYLDYLSNKPEKVLSDALTNTMVSVLDRKPFSSINNIVLESKSSTQPYTAKINLNTKQANNNSDNSATLTFESGKTNMSLTGSLITIGSDTAYVKFDNLVKTSQGLYSSNPDMRPLIKQVDPLIKQIDGRWIKIDSKGLAQSGVVASSDQTDACTKAIGNLKISRADQPKVNKIYSQNQFIQTVQVLPREVIDGEKSFHYQIKFNEEKTISFVKALIELPSFADVKSSCHINPQDFDKQIQDLKSQQKDNQNPPTFELWVGEKTRLPTKVKVSASQTDVSVVLNSTLKLNANNVQITAPTDYIEYQQLQKQIEKSVGSFSTSNLIQSTTANIQKF